MSFFNGTTELVTVDLRSRIDFRKIDQSMACEDRIQAAQGHQSADGGFTFAKSE